MVTFHDVQKPLHEETDVLASAVITAHASFSTLQHTHTYEAPKHFETNRTHVDDFAASDSLLTGHGGQY